MLQCYENVIWCPKFRRDRLEVEKIQRRARKLIPNLISLPWRDRLEALRLPSLCYHRRWGDMVQVYKILKDTDRLESNQFFSLADISNTRGHSLKLVKCRWSSSFSQNVLTYYWNGLPAQIVDSPTLNTFKSWLDKLWTREHYNMP